LEIRNIIRQNKKYEGCHSDFRQARIVLYGAGFDGTSSYRAGSRFAPMAIRSETYFAQEDYSPYFDRDLAEKPVHDLGDVEIIFGNTAGTLQRIQAVSEYIVSHDKIPVCIGGEHLVTLPAITPLIQKYPDLHVVQLDAHLDLMDELFGAKLSHGAVMRRVCELLEPTRRIYQIGVRSGNKDEYAFAASHTYLFPFDTVGFLKVSDTLRSKPVYVTIDLDVFDPSLIPGTGTPEAGGIFFPQYIELLKKLDHLNIVGADVVELSPHIDSTQVSTIVASKILRELLLII
jgi:agmatinase